MGTRTKDDRPSSSYRRSPPRDERLRDQRRQGSGSAEPGQITSFTTYSERPRQNSGPAGRAGLPPRPGSYREREDRRGSPPPHSSFGHSARSPKSPYGRSRDAWSGSPPRKPSYDRGPSGKEDKGKGKEKSFDAMDQFTQSLHDTLLSTTVHTLAGRQLSRLSSFSNLDPSHPAIVEARKNLVAAEEALWNHQIQVQQAFAQLIRRTGGISADVLDMDEIRARLARLEGQYAGASRQPPPPAEAPPLPPPEPGAQKDVEMADEPQPGQPIKVKDAIRTIFKRLASVEAAKLDMEEKCEDLEGLIWSQAEERVERQMTWEQLERDRRATRQSKPQEAGPSGTTEPNVAERIPVAGPSGSGTGPSGSTVIEAPKPERVITLSVSPEPLEITPIDPPSSSSAKGKEVDRSPPLDTGTAAKIERLELELQRLQGVVERLQHNSVQREHAIVQGMRAEYAEVVKKELQKVALSYENRYPTTKANGTESSAITINGSPAGQGVPLQNGSPSAPQLTRTPSVQNASPLTQPPPRQSGQPQVEFPSVNTQNLANPAMRQQLSPQHAHRLSPQGVPQQLAVDLAEHARVQRFISQGMVPPAAQTQYPLVNPYGQPIQNGNRLPDKPAQAGASSSPYQQNMEVPRPTSNPDHYASQTQPQPPPVPVQAQSFNGQTLTIPVGNQGRVATVTQIAADRWAVVVDGVTRVAGAEDLNRWTGM